MDEIRNKVVLVGLNSPVLRKEENADEESMAELAALVETAEGGGGTALLREYRGGHGDL